MDGSGSVHAIDGLTSVERLSRELRHAIGSARLLPGQELAVRRLAAQRQVRYSTLAELLVGLERDGLLVVTGESVRVAPLDPAELASVFALRRTLEAHLLERACAQLTEGELHRLDALVAHRVPSTPTSEFVESFRQFHLRFFAPAASTVELGLLGHVHESTQRYYSLGLRAESVGGGPVLTAATRRRLGNHCLRYHALVATVRLGHVAAARELMRTLGTDSELLARQALEVEWRAETWPATSEASA